jgi:hypothetical protein
MGLEYNMQLIMSGVLNCVQLVGVASSLWTMDRIGRRPLLLWGSLVMFISHLIISILVGKFSHDWPSYRPEGWASVAMLLVYMLGFGASWVNYNFSSRCQHPLMIFKRARYHGQCHQKSSRPPFVLRASRKSSLLFPQPISNPLTHTSKTLNLLQLALQLHHRPHHPTVGGKHRLRRIRFLCCILLAFALLGVLLRARDGWQDARRNGPGLW